MTYESIFDRFAMHKDKSDYADILIDLRLTADQYNDDDLPVCDMTMRDIISDIAYYGEMCDWTEEIIDGLLGTKLVYGCDSATMYHKTKQECEELCCHYCQFVGECDGPKTFEIMEVG